MTEEYILWPGIDGNTDDREQNINITVRTDKRHTTGPKSYMTGLFRKCIHEIRNKNIP